MKTIKDVFLSFHQELQALYNRNETEAITLLVLEELTGMVRSVIKAFPEKKIPIDTAEKLTDILKELKTGKPVQYILGETEFYGLRFLVNPAVLIPRPETEELVEWVLHSWKLNRGTAKALTVLDIGTGSGCIAISLKKHLPGARVTAVDISADALETARQNASINGVDVNFVLDDILNPASEILQTSYDMIISNPPYVTLHEKTRMHANVTDFEPHTALFVPEHDPLVFYKAIAGFAAIKLKPGGLLYFEINESFGKETMQLLADKNFSNIQLRKDMSGKNRMTKAQLSAT